MKLLILTVKNWGPHKDLTIDLDSSIAGIVGANGTGKSNILQAIRFALTATLPANKDDVIRQGATSAYVKLVFSVHGKIGCIEREINRKTSKAKLCWDNKEITKKVEILERIEALMGVDKDALENAVFTEQGAVDKLVRGTPAERQTLFFKVLNLNFLAKRAERVGQEAKLMRSNITDLTPVRDSIIGAIAETEADIQDLQNNLSKLEDPTDKIKALEQELSICNEVNSAGVLIDTLRMQQLSLKGNIEYLMSTYGVPVSDNISSADVEALMSALTTKHKDYQKLALETMQHVQAWDNYNMHVAIRDDNVAEKNALLTHLRSFVTENSFWLQFDLDSKDAELAFNTAYEEIKEIENATFAKSALDIEKSKLAHLEYEAEKLLENLGILSTKMLEIDSMLLQLSTDRDTKRKALDLVAEKRASKKWKYEVLKGICPENATVCPLCGSAIPDLTTAQLEEAEIGYMDADSLYKCLEYEYNKIAAELDSRRVEKANVAAEFAQLLGSQKQNNSDIKSLRESVETLSESYAQICTENPEIKDDVDIDELFKFAAEYQKAAPRLEAFGKIIYREKEELQSMANSLPACSLKECKTAYEKNKFEMDRIAEDIRVKSPGCYKYISNCNRIEQAEETINKYSDIVLRPIVVIEHELDAAKAAMVERSNLIYAIAIKQKDIESEHVKLDSVNSKIAEYDTQLNTIQLLETAKDVLSRPNMPMAFASNIFSNMTVNVNDLLGQMGANFIVRPDPVEPISYVFKRIDSDSGAWMKQDRLSGGQAIRLSLAMLITMQRMLLPSIGLLILDEPSSHVDAEGIENMADLFRSLTNTFTAARMQVIMVDHSDILIDACGKKFNLNKYLS